MKIYEPKISSPFDFLWELKTNKVIFISLRSYGGKKRTFCPHFCQHLPITSTFRTVTGTSNCGPRWTNHLETGWSSKKTKCFTPMKNFLISKIVNKRKIVHFRSNFRLKNKLQQRLSYKLLYYLKKHVWIAVILVTKLR